MDIRQLRYFLSMVEQGSITAASAVLNVAQPALSLHLKNMEEQLQTKLLIRSKAGVEPTEAGALLYRRAGMLLDDLARAEDDIRSLESDPTGVVRIGLPGTISGIIALPLMEAVRARYPRIKLNIVEAMSGFIADWLSEGQIDMAVLYSQAKDQAIASEPLLEEELVVLWPGDQPGPTELGLNLLNEVTMVLPSAAHGLRVQIDTALQSLGIKHDVAVEIDSYANIKQLVVAGFGASILPLHAVQREVQEGQLSISRVSPPGFWRSAHLSYPAARQATRSQLAVRDLLREVVSDLLKGGAWVGGQAIRSEE